MLKGAGSRAIWMDAPRALLAGATLPPAQAWAGYALVALAMWGAWRATDIEEIKGKAQAQKIKLKNLELLVPVSRSFQVASLKTW